MKILYFIPRYDGAALANHIHTEVINVWAQQGVQTEVLSLAAGQRRLSSQLEDGIMVHRLPVSASLPLKLANRALDPLLHYPYLAGALACCRRFLQGRRYDLMHIETAFPLGLVAALLPRSLRPPLAITLPGADIMAEPEFDYGYGRFRSVRRLLPFVFRQAALLRADSPQIRDLAIRLGAEATRVTAIPYNITDNCYPPAHTNLEQLRATSRTEVITHHGLDPQRPIIVSLSRLHPFKGIAYLVEAMRLVQRAGMHPQLLIVGPSRNTPRFGDYGTYLRERAEALGVAGAITMVGTVAQELASTYLAAATVAVVPSVAESFNRVTIEAAAVGTPAVVTRTTGVSAYVAEQHAGRVVEPKSAAAIAEAILLLLGNQKLWHNCSTQARAMSARFSSTTIGTALLDLYRPYMSGKSCR